MPFTGEVIMVRRPFTHSQLERGPAVIRALHSLTDEHTQAVRAAATSKSGGTWLIHTTYDYEGYLSIMVDHTDDNAGKPSYLISGTIHQIDLAEIRDDHLQVIMHSGSIEAITNELNERLRS